MEDPSIIPEDTLCAFIMRISEALKIYEHNPIDVSIQRLLNILKSLNTGMVSAKIQESFKPKE